MKPYYTDEHVTLWHGDALAALREIPSASVDAVITDPPYSSGGMIRGDRVQDVHTKYVNSSSSSHEDIEAFSGDTRDSFGYWFWCSVWLGECQRILKPGGISALFTDWRQLASTIGGIQSGGCVFRGVVPWYKPSARPVQGRWANACEYVVWGTNGPRPLEILGPVAFPGFYQAGSPREREHLTQKPLEVMRDLVKIIPPGGTVLDPFMGAGTTGVAAVLEGRRFIGAEMVEHFVKIGERRIRMAQGQAVPAGAQGVLDFGQPA